MLYCYAMHCCAGQLAVAREQHPRRLPGCCAFADGLQARTASHRESDLQNHCRTTQQLHGLCSQRVSPSGPVLDQLDYEATLPSSPFFSCPNHVKHVIVTPGAKRVWLAEELKQTWHGAQTAVRSLLTYRSCFEDTAPRQASGQRDQKVAHQHLPDLTPRLRIVGEGCE